MGREGQVGAVCHFLKDAQGGPHCTGEIAAKIWRRGGREPCSSLGGGAAPEMAEVGLCLRTGKEASGAGVAARGKGRDGQ